MTMMNTRYLLIFIFVRLKANYYKTRYDAFQQATRLVQITYLNDCHHLRGQGHDELA